MPDNPTPHFNWWREPLVHFAVLAGLLFVIDSLSNRAQKPEIIVTGQTIDYLVQQREDLELRDLTAEERQAVIDDYIEEEILYAEAYSRGLDRADSRMRRNLILKMRGLLAAGVGEPTVADLRAWYQANPERYLRPESWSFEQLFFNSRDALPQDLEGRLKSGRGRVPMEMTRRELVSAFGPEAAAVVAAIDDDGWHGPIESPQGLHFIRVTGHRAESRLPYEEVEPYLSGDWVLAKTRERIQAEVGKLRGEYRIVIEEEVNRQ